MKLRILGSSSSGNGYILENDTEALIIEAGMRLSTVKKALGFNISKVVGCLVSHEHGDHAKYIQSYMEAGIDVFTSKEVFDSKETGINNFRGKKLTPEVTVPIGSFKVMAFEVSHDVRCFGFLIGHPETGSILFATDTFKLDYNFPGLSHVILEANYADDVVENNIMSGSLHPSMRMRLLETHMELETTKSIISQMDKSSIINIVLIHLSANNSDRNRFIREVQQVSGAQVFAAQKDMEIEFNKQPF